MSAILAPAVAAPPKSRNKFWLGFALLLPLALINLTAFVMPVLEAVTINGTITDVKISYPADLTKQMLAFSRFGRALR